MIPSLPQSLVLERGVFAPRAAREHARRCCTGITSKRHADEVTVVVSEMVTNAVKYGTGEIRLVLRVSRGEVFVAVQDQGSAFVVPLLVVSPFRERGRGLPIVDSLASDWGIDSLGGAGNLVWCVVHGGARHGNATRARPAAAFLLGKSDRLDEPGDDDPVPPSLTTVA